MESKASALTLTSDCRARSVLLALTLAAAACTGEIGGASGPGSVATTGGTSSSPDGTGVAVEAGVEAPSPRFIRQLTLSEYRNTVADLLFLAAPDTTRVPADVPLEGYTTNVAASFVSENHLDAYVAIGIALADRAVAESYSKLVPCAMDDQACAGQFIDAFGRRAFRRPMIADEKARYLALFSLPGVTEGNFKAGVAHVISAMLASPYFLFRTELGDDAGGGKFALSPYEVASALSYSYWGSMPDEALFRAAELGQLGQKPEIESQARRLLADARGRSHVGQFFFEWTQSARAYVASKDLAAYPGRFQNEADVSSVVSAMEDEAQAFFGSVVFDSTKKFRELFLADYTFVNDRLANYYGLAAPGSTNVATKVTLPATSQRGGLLTLGMFLFGHSRTDQSSPVQRGHLVRANMLCADVPPPPPGVDAAIKPDTPGRTGRQQIEALTGSGTCASCHSLLNPVGFALESFGGAAEERAIDNDEPVDATGQLVGVPGFAEPVSFNGARDLSRILADSPQAQACLAAHYHRYVRGYVATGSDVAAVSKLSDQFVTQNLDLPELFVQVALQDSFTTRRSVEVLEQ